MDKRTKQYSPLTLLRRGLEYAQEVAKAGGKDIVQKQEPKPVVRHTVFPEGFTPPEENSEEQE